MNISENIPIIQEYLDEIKTVMESNSFLSGTDKSSTVSIAYGDDSSRQCQCKIKSLDVFFDCISTSNQVTAYTRLEEDIIEPVNCAYVYLSNYTSRQVEDYISNAIELITKSTAENPNMTLLLDFISKGRIFSANKLLSLHNHVVSAISRHIGVIIEARVLTFSKRIIPIELLLEAYRAGLYPFGWDFEDNSLFCLNPYH
jgi:hypothetical protein